MDVISLHQAGFTNAVAALGTSFTSGHASLIKRYVDEVVLSFDSDEAGTKAALRAIPYLREVGLKIKVLDMKPYKDPDEFIKELGVEEYEKRVKEAINFFIFEVGAKEKEYNQNDPQEKTAFHNEVAKMLLEFKDDVERKNYLEAVCNEFDIPRDGLESLVKSKALTYVGKENKFEEKQYVSKEQKKDNALVGAERILLACLLDEPKIFDKVKEVIKPDDFGDEFHINVAKKFWEQMENGNPNPASIMDQFTDEEEHKKVAALFVSPINTKLEEGELEKAINDAIIKIKKESLDRKAANASDINELQELMKQQKELEKVYIKL